MILCNTLNTKVNPPSETGLARVSYFTGTVYYHHICIYLQDDRRDETINIQELYIQNQIQIERSKRS